MAYWLIKSEPDVYSIDDLKRDKTTVWDGVRNYQARNFLRSMAPGDEVLFYHSNTEPAAVVGVCRVVREAYPDPSQFDERSEYFDERVPKEKPRWFAPDLQFVKKLPRPVPLEQLRKNPKLTEMQLLKRGNRLSVLPLTAAEYRAILSTGACKRH